MKKIFYKHSKFYNKALKNSADKCPDINYIKMLSSNLWHTFLALIEKHFPRNNILSKIFNKNTLKLNYSYTENLEKIKKKHNKILRNSDPEIRINNSKEKLCNCRNPINCPLNNKCLTESIVYQCTISSIE